MPWHSTLNLQLGLQHSRGVQFILGVLHFCFSFLLMAWKSSSQWLRSPVPTSSCLLMSDWLSSLEAIWNVKQQIEELSSVAVSFCDSDVQIKINLGKNFVMFCDIIQYIYREIPSAFSPCSPSPPSRPILSEQYSHPTTAADATFGYPYAPSHCRHNQRLKPSTPLLRCLYLFHRESPLYSEILSTMYFHF